MITRKLVFKPHFNRFLFKRNFIAFFLTVFIFGGIILIAYIENKEIDLLFWYVTAVIFPIVFIGWISFNFLYIRLIIYELDKNEIMTRKGLIQKKVMPAIMISKMLQKCKAMDLSIAHQ